MGVEGIFGGLDAAGRSMAWWALVVNVQALVLLVLAMAADRVLTRRVSPGLRVLLYVPVLVRAVVPMTAVWSAPWWRGAAAVVEYGAWRGEEAGAVGAALASAGGAVESAGSSGGTVWWGAAVVVVYAAGVVVLGVRWAREARRLGAVVRGARPSGGDAAVLISETEGPLVAGVWRPRIVAPAWLLGEESLGLVLAHERAHVERRDPLLAAAVRGCCVLAWPVAAVRVAGSRIRGLMEQACDERAIAAGGRTQEMVMKYAKTMIEVAGRVGGAGANGGAGGALAFGASLRSRIAALRPGRRWPAGLQAAAAAVIPAVLLACGTAGPSGETAMSDAATAAPAAATAAPAAGQLAPAAEEVSAVRTVSLRILSGLPTGPTGEGLLPFDGGSPAHATGRRSDLGRLFSQMEGVESLAAPRLMVNVGQEAMVTVGEAGSSMSTRVVVLPSEKGEVRVSVEYREGAADDYRMPAATFTFRQDEYLAVWVVGGFGLPPRTLLMTVGPADEKVEEGC